MHLDECGRDKRKNKLASLTLGDDTSPRSLVLAQISSISSSAEAAKILTFLAQQLSLRIGLKGAKLVIRTSPPISLVLVGFFDRGTENRLRHWSAHIQSAIDSLRYVTYAGAQVACDRLAQTLRKEVGSELAKQAHAIGVPRGGLIVLGMLSYALNLRHMQVTGSPPPDALLLVVDDIALTGNRLHRFLQRYPNHKMVIATLFSHPELRTAMVRKKSRVKRFVSAHDLHDKARERSDYEKWKAQWRERRIGKRYWSGQADHICFPWSEPDIGVWNPETEVVEEGLRFAPPEQCLRNRYVSRASKKQTQGIQVQPEAAGPIKPPDAVFFGTVGKSTIVANPDADVCIELQDTAAAIWHAIIEKGTRDRVVDSLLDEYDIKRSALSDHVDQFIQQLEEIGLLEVTTT